MTFKIILCVFFAINEVFFTIGNQKLFYFPKKCLKYQKKSELSGFNYQMVSRGRTILTGF